MHFQKKCVGPISERTSQPPHVVSPGCQDWARINFLESFRTRHVGLGMSDLVGGEELGLERLDGLNPIVKSVLVDVATTDNADDVAGSLKIAFAR